MNSPPVNLESMHFADTRDRAIDRPFESGEMKKRSARSQLTFINFASLLTGLLFLYDGHSPGWSLFTCMSLVLFSMLAVAWTIAGLAWLGEENRPRRLVFSVFRLAVAPLISVVCAVLVIFAVPAKIGLWASLKDFNHLLETSVPRQVTTLNQRVGIYDVIKFARDEKGGVYFVTGQYRDRLTGECVCVGFAVHPSRGTTPFGQADYHLTKVSGEWWTFSVSDRMD